MGSENQKLTHCLASRPRSSCWCGLQGAGKTTNGAKLAGLYQKAGQTPAARRLRHLPSRGHQAAAGRRRTAGHPGLRDGAERTRWRSPKPRIAHAKKHGNDMVFLDTAGRLHIDEALMDELQAIKDAGAAQRDPAGRRRDDRPGRGQRRRRPSTKQLDIDRRDAHQARRRRPRRRGPVASRPSPASRSSLSARAKSSTRSSRSTPTAWPPVSWAWATC